MNDYVSQFACLLNHGALLYKEVNKRIDLRVKHKHVWNVAMNVLQNIVGFVQNTTTYPLGRYSLQLLLLKTSMAYLVQIKTSFGMQFIENS